MSLLPRSSQLCTRCARLAIDSTSQSLRSNSRSITFSSPLFSNTSSASSSSSSSTSTTQESRESGGISTVKHEKTVGGQKINTWFLDPSFSPSTPSKTANNETSTSSSLNTQIRQPIFTPYNASTTSPDASAETASAPMPPLPSNTPSQLHPLHSFLTSSTTEAADVIQLSTVQMFDTALLNEYLEKRGEGSMLDDVDGKERGGNWDWVVTAVVKGRGRGVVARADGVVRRWLLKHPLAPSVEPTKLAYPKTPRISPDSDWSIIPLNLGSHAESGGVRACVNLLSEEGRLRWRLEDLWNARG
ncbi:hypothetical protein IAU59_004337 [Kwoniella sp. CBS 9459]